MKIKKMFLFICLVFIVLKSNSVFAQKHHQPRTIVTTDGELDDVDSFIRLLLYANEFKIEGLVISSSQWHYKGDGKGTKFISEMDMTKKMYGERSELRWPGTQWIYDLVKAYGEVYPNLKLHSPFYPSENYLKNLIKIGNIDFEGEMKKDTEGSDFIKNKLLDNDISPLYLQVWGGTNTIARALKAIEDKYKNTPKWKTIYDKICKKAIIYAILDQDATYRKYIATHWKDIKVYYNSKQFWCLAYFWKTAVPKELHHVLEGKFMSERIINNHGALTKKYYSYGDGNPPAGEIEDIYSDTLKMKNNQWGSFGKYDFISEGDSPAFLHLVNVGLGNLENLQIGGWGGRLIQSSENPKRWEDGEKAADFNPFTQMKDLAYAQTRWLEQIQNDFAARADWCIKNYINANHEPNVNLISPAFMLAKPNGKVLLKGSATDPDGNKLNFKWWQYQEVGTYKGKVDINNANKMQANMNMPSDIKKGETIHLILEVSDDGQPQLTRYKRVIIKSD